VIWTGVVGGLVGGLVGGWPVVLTATHMRRRLLSLADLWDAEARQMRADSVTNGLDPAQSPALRDANLTMFHADEVRQQVCGKGQIRLRRRTGIEL